MNLVLLQYAKCKQRVYKQHSQTRVKVVSHYQLSVTKSGAVPCNTTTTLKIPALAIKKTHTELHNLYFHFYNVAILCLNYCSLYSKIQNAQVLTSTR